jgi:hypothetical protein
VLLLLTHGGTSKAVGASLQETQQQVCAVWRWGNCVFFVVCVSRSASVARVTALDDSSSFVYRDDAP